MSKKDTIRSKNKLGTSSATLLTKDKLKLLSIAVGGSAIIVWLFMLCCIKQQSFAVDRQLQKWKVIYHLTDEQVSRLREIELSFHGNGNPFTNFSTHTAEEDFKHHQFLSSLMNREDGARFMADMEHTPRRY